MSAGLEHCLQAFRSSTLSGTQCCSPTASPIGCPASSMTSSAFSKASQVFAKFGAPRGAAGLTQRAPTWDAYPASLSERLAAYKQWKASAGISGKPTQAEFRRFVGAHRPNSRGSTLYFEDGGFAAWSKRVGSTHGNTAGSQTAWLYRLESDTGGFLKWGISQDPMTRYSQSFMLDKHIIPIHCGADAWSLESRTVAW